MGKEAQRGLNILLYFKAILKHIFILHGCYKEARLWAVATVIQLQAFNSCDVIIIIRNVTWYTLNNML